MAGGRLIAPDTPYGLREFAYVDPDGAVAGAGMALMATGFLWWTGLPVRGSYLAGILPGLLIFGLRLGSGGVAGSIAAVAGVGGLRHCLRAEQRRVPDRRCAGNRRPVHGRGLARRRFDDAARPPAGFHGAFVAGAVITALAKLVALAPHRGATAPGAVRPALALDESC